MKVNGGMERTWTGQLRPASDAEHLAFVSWLSGPTGLSLLARSRLTSYRLVEADGRITVVLGADDPPALVSFLRNDRSSIGTPETFIRSQVINSGPTTAR